MKTLFLIILFLISFCSYNIFSQDETEPINTDRPDQTEGPEVIQPLVFQMESGFVYEKTTDQPDYKETNFSVPQTLLRFGIMRFLELRAYLEYHATHAEYPLNQSPLNLNKTYSGMIPAKFGIKLKLVDGEKLIPTTAVLFDLTFPKFAGKDFAADYIAPTIILSTDFELSKKISVGDNLILFWDGVNPRSTEAYTISASYNISKKTSVFLEAYGFYQKGTDADNRLDAGLTFLTSNSTQLDAAAGIGL